MTDEEIVARVLASNSSQNATARDKIANEKWQEFSGIAREILAALYKPRPMETAPRPMRYDHPIQLLIENTSAHDTKFWSPALWLGKNPGTFEWWCTHANIGFLDENYPHLRAIGWLPMPPIPPSGGDG